MRAIAALACVLALGVAGCPRTRRAPAPPGTRADEKLETAEVLYAHGAPGWEIGGWSRREVDAAGPARVDMSNAGGWSLEHRGTSAAYGALAFRYKAPPDFGEFLEVRVDANRAVTFPRVKIGPQHRRDAGDGWTEVVIPMRALDPDGLPFDRVVLRAAVSVPSELVLFDDVVLTRGLGEMPDASTETTTRDAAMLVDCRAKTWKISPLIYGIAFDPMHDAKDKQQFQMGATARRWGGNPSSRYNWELGNAWNTANDYYFENVNYTPDPNYSYARFLADDAAHGMKTALTMPMLGWVAKDTSSYSFSVKDFKDQQSVDPYKPDAGNGRGKDGKPLTPGPQARTSVPASPEFVRRWVAAIRAADGRARTRSVHQYILDNEPALWSSTHRDVHPEPVTYDELLDKTIAYGSAIREVDPDAVIAGPAEWGWTNFFYSGKDSTVGTAFKPDRRAHGDEPLLPWYLKKLAEYEKTHGTRILDVVDVHFYPQGERLYGANGATDPDGAARRIRAARALWDPTYVDESWIKEPVRLLPRLQEWIDANYPGRGISIGEWNFGGEGHISGALAIAEALGRFAQADLTSAFYWSYPPADSPAFWAFRAYRNFDGHNGRFLDEYVPSQAPGESSLFASRDETGTHFVLIALNLAPDAMTARIDMSSCGKIASRSAYVLTESSHGLAARAPIAPAKGAAQGARRRDDLVLTEGLPGYSVTVLDVQIEPQK